MSIAKTKRLFRSEKDRVVAGVSGGLGEYFSIDPVLFRLAFIFTTIAGGPGLIAYIVMWLIIPSESNIKDSTSVETTVKENFEDVKKTVTGAIDEVKKRVNSNKSKTESPITEAE